MFRCNECGEIMADDEAITIDASFPVPYGEGMVMKPEQEIKCCYCGSDEVSYSL